MELLREHPILIFNHNKEVCFTFNGKIMQGYEGVPITVALHANGVRTYRITPIAQRPTWFFFAL